MNILAAKEKGELNIYIYLYMGQPNIYFLLSN